MRTSSTIGSALSALFVAFAMMSPAPARADDYPSKPIQLVVPYPPGGFTDIVGRLAAEKLSGSLGQRVVVDNRGGGGGTIGSGLVAKAAPDGYTLLIVAVDLAINETLMADRIAYKVRDFAPISEIAWSPIVLVVNKDFKPKTISDLVAAAKAQPGGISFGSGGIGTGGHLALEMLKARAGIDLVHVPYRGNGPAITEVVGGRIAGMFIQYAVARPHVAAGSIRVLATPSSKRLAAIPDVPTVAESGLPGFSVEPWFGVVAPAHTPKAVIDKVHAGLVEAMRSPDVVKRLDQLGAEAMATSPEEFDQLIQREVRDWRKIIVDAKIRLE